MYPELIVGLNEQMQLRRAIQRRFLSVLIEDTLVGHRCPSRLDELQKGPVNYM